jgi:lipid II:glycine glycyltransferase (peptidoglycan interpeptide bridge formation enzyme)
MQVECGISTDQEEWNAFVAQEPSFGLLQSWEWGEFKEKLGWKAFRIAAKQDGHVVAGAQMLISSVIPGLASVAYIPRGPIGNWLDTEIADRLLNELHQIARSHKAAFLRIEPPLLNEPVFHRILEQHHFRASPNTNQPRATIIVNLDQELDDILMQMRKKTRQHVRKAVREGITVRIGCRGDLSTFYDVMRYTSRRKHFPHRSRDYYEHEWQTFADSEQTVLLMAVHRNQIEAVDEVYCFGKHAAEFHAGSLDSSENLYANYLLVWEAIKWAKARGCRTCDMWGIPDEISQILADGNDPPASDRTDGLWGVYQFKRGFSRNIVCYVGAYDYVYSTLLYALISNRLFNVDTLQWVEAWLDWLKRARRSRTINQPRTERGTEY